ncbi:MAG: diguanylate cyclase [Candidatus Sericytochromatia bacterium]
MNSSLSSHQFFEKIQNLCHDTFNEKEVITGLSKVLEVIYEFFEPENASFYLILDHKLCSISAINEEDVLEVNIDHEDEKKLIATNFTLDAAQLSMYSSLINLNIDKLRVMLLMPLSYNNNFLGFVTLGRKSLGGFYSENEKFIFTLVVSYISRLVYYSDSYIEASGKTAEEMCLKNLTDPLSGVYVKSYIEQRFKEQMKESIRYKKPESIAIVKVNNLDYIRENYGQQLVNKILHDTGAFISEFIRKDVDLVGKFSDDSFLILLSSTGFHGALIFSDRLRVKLSSLKYDSFPDLFLYFSLGLTSLEESDNDKDKVLEKVIRALENSEKQEGNILSYCYQNKVEEHVTEIEKISGLSSDIIRSALENNVFLLDEYGNEIDFTKTVHKGWFNIQRN